MLKIDVDPGSPLFSRAHIERLLARAGFRLHSLRKERSSSGKGWHVFVRLTTPTTSPLEQVALQAILGSDRYREACNVQRVRTIATLPPRLRRFWESRWNVFYEGKRG